MKFFIPHTENETKQEDVYTSIVKFAEETTGWVISDKRIFSLRYFHNGKEHYSEVGKKESVDGYYEEVIAILDSNTYLVCTPQRGVIRGLPILVGKQEVDHVVYFETKSST